MTNQLSYSVRNRDAGWLVMLLLLCSAICGCESRDSNPRRARTESTLWVLKAVIFACEKDGRDMQGITSVAELLAIAEEARYITPADIASKELEHDDWGRRLAWKYQKDGTVTVIRISSSGTNGLDEGRGGDDMYIEITFETGKAPKIERTKPD